MGDTKKHKKNYSTPRILWQKDRIEQEKKIIQDYRLKNKTEIWKMNSLMKRYTAGAKKLISERSKQADIEKTQMMRKLARYGLLSQNARIEDVLNLKIEDFLNRRLQTMLVKLGYARTMKQSRQFIVHQHVRVGDKAITSPSYLVSLDEEGKISFDPASSLFSPDHPERFVKEVVPVAKEPSEKTESKDNVKEPKQKESKENKRKKDTKK